VPHPTTSRPIIGITPDITDGKLTVSRAYADMVIRAGGAPVILVCDPSLIPHYLKLCDGFILTGGGDPDTTQWGTPMHPQARPVHPDRQSFETALLGALDGHRETPVLGICLGMQMMGLHAGGGGALDQHLPDNFTTADDHCDKRTHTVTGELGCGEVNSHHHQALADPPPPGFRVIARSHDGVIEAVRRDDRPYYLGVQWHPERTDDAQLGLGVIVNLLEACRRSIHRSRR
jgi:putative glutamine amidotransferase